MRGERLKKPPRRGIRESQENRLREQFEAAMVPPAFHLEPASRRAKLAEASHEVLHRLAQEQPRRLDLAFLEITAQFHPPRLEPPRIAGSASAHHVRSENVSHTILRGGDWAKRASVCNVPASSTAAPSMASAGSVATPSSTSRPLCRERVEIGSSMRRVNHYCVTRDNTARSRVRAPRRTSAARPCAAFRRRNAADSGTSTRDAPRSASWNSRAGTCTSTALRRQTMRALRAGLE